MPLKKALPKETPKSKTPPTKKAAKKAAPKPAKKARVAKRETPKAYLLGRLVYKEEHLAFMKESLKILGPKVEPKDLPGASQSANSMVGQWVLSYSDGSAEEQVAFFDDGTLNVDGSPGLWRQQGAALVFETNGRYAEYQGLIEGDSASGTARNIVKYSWSWSAKRSAS